MAVWGHGLGELRPGGLGIGRLGAILGPLLAAELIARRWSSGDIFRAAVVPAASGARQPAIVSPNKVARSASNSAATAIAPFKNSLF